MKIIFNWAFIFTILSFTACENDNDIYINEDDKLLGSWINPIYDETITTFERANDLKEDGYGISFLSNKKFIERNSGWCGTPPITYTNYLGNWEERDSIIEITIDNGINGMNSFRLKIISLKEASLIVEREN